MDGQSNQGVLDAINGPPGVGPGTFFDQPAPGGGFVAGDNGASDLAALTGGGNFFASVPSWVWWVVGGVIVFRIIKR